VHYAVTNAEMELRLYDPNPPAGMVLIPGGVNAGTDPDFGAYSLTVDAFYMDRYEVTKALWDEVYAWAVTNGYSFDNADQARRPNIQCKPLIGTTA
jgi:formylglycine-generating enzyme required for sulfatase activity